MPTSTKRNYDYDEDDAEAGGNGNAAAVVTNYQRMSGGEEDDDASSVAVAVNAPQRQHPNASYSSTTSHSNNDNDNDGSDDSSFVSNKSRRSHRGLAKDPNKLSAYRKHQRQKSQGQQLVTFLTRKQAKRDAKKQAKKNHRRHPSSSGSMRSVASSSSAAAANANDNNMVMHKMSLAELIEHNLYHVKQDRGYLSIWISVVQTLILFVMMVGCGGVAPLSINPMIGPYPDALSYWGGKNAVDILTDHEWWRLLTPIFLHAGILHWMCNVFVQLETGAFFEREWGWKRWLIIYASSAVGSSVLSTCVLPNRLSVGSSGAVMGLFGGKLSEVFCRWCESRKTDLAQLGFDIRKDQMKGVLISVVLVALCSLIPFVDWAAHFGGLVAGFVVGLVVFSFTIKTKLWLVIWCLVGIGGTLTCFIMALKYMYTEVEPSEDLRDVCGYYQQYFEDYECHCMLDRHEGG